MFPPCSGSPPTPWGSSACEILPPPQTPPPGAGSGQFGGGAAPALTSARRELTRGVRAPRARSGAPRQPQRAPTKPRRRSKRPPSRRKIVPRRPRWPADGPRCRQDAPRGFQEASQEGPERTKSLIPHMLSGVLVFFPPASHPRLLTHLPPPLLLHLTCNIVHIHSRTHIIHIHKTHIRRPSHSHDTRPTQDIRVGFA